MLLEFGADNYKNFANGFLLSMEADIEQQDLAYSIQTERVENKDYHALSSAVIYGPNAAGKSNMTNALDTFKQIVLRGHIDNGIPTRPLGINDAGSTLELIPNQFSNVPKPIGFTVKFIADDILYEYSFEAEIGTFLDSAYSRRVLTEILSVNGIQVFSRTGQDFDFGALDKVPDTTWGSADKNRRSVAQLVSKMARPKDLFLMNGFRTAVSPEIAERVREWLATRLIVMCNSQNVEILADDHAARGFQPIDGSDRLLSELGSNGDVAGYVYSGQATPRLHVRINETTMGGALMNAESYESYGTVRLLRIWPVIVEALHTGATLVLDEFDASLHPAIAQGIINAFHDDEINTNHAQLIVNTHNPVHLRSDLYRRDEIHFVQPAEGECSSEHYTLADFGTAGDNGARMEEAYMRKYLRDAYGAYPWTDVCDLLVESIARRANASRGNAAATEPTALPDVASHIIDDRSMGNVTPA